MIYRLFLGGLLLLLLLFATPSAWSQGQVAAPGTAERSHHDWLLACVLGPSRTPSVTMLGSITSDNAQTVARRTLSECEVHLAKPDVQRRLASIQMGTDLLQSARQLANSSHVDWLAACLRDVAAIEPGMTRAQLSLRFRQQGGIFTPERQFFHHQTCIYLQLDVRFQNHPESHRRNLHPGDVVTTVGPASLTLVAAD